MTPVYRAVTTALLNEFGSISAIMAGSASRQLKAARGDHRVVARLQNASELFLAVTKDRLQRRDVLKSFADVQRYFDIRMRDVAVEEVRALYLDAAHGLIRDDLVAQGTVDETTVYPRTIIARALELGANGLILAHNHPSGLSRPSRADLDWTHRIARAARTVDIALHDHLIVARDGIASLRRLGHL